MSDSNINENPFAALFPSPEDADTFKSLMPQIVLSSEKHCSRETCIIQESNNVEVVSTNEKRRMINCDDKVQVNYLCEEIFRITLNKELSCATERPTRCVYLEESYFSLNKETLLSLEFLEQVVFERLMLSEPEKYVIVTRGNFEDCQAEDKAGEKRIIYYLYDCYFRLTRLAKSMNPTVEHTLEHLIVSQASTALSHPEFFVHSLPQNELLELLLQYHQEAGHNETLSSFMVSVADCIYSRHKAGEDDISLKDVLSVSFSALNERFLNISLGNSSTFFLLGVLQYFTKSSLLSMALLDYSIPSKIGNARAYQDSLLGALLAISCLPRKETDSYEFFDKPSHYTAQEHSITEQNLWTPLYNLCAEAHQLFYTLLRQSPDTRHKLLTWIGNCLYANNDRGKLWNNQLPEIFGIVQASDGFMLNFGAVLLKLCAPFSEPFSSKLLKIDPTYCTAQACTDDDAKERNIHLKDLYKETCIISSEEQDLINLVDTKYNFPTECFFATHHALVLGFHVVHERLLKISQELGRTQRLYEEARAQGGESSDIVQRIKDNMEKGMTKFLSIKTALLEPQTLEALLRFHVATATWLINVATNPDRKQFKVLTIPFTSEVPPCVACIPEFIFENIVDCVLFLRRFSIKTFEVSGAALDHLVTLILVFMGSPERMKNPHLRARLAEMLEALMPAKEGVHYNTMLPCEYRERLFKENEFISELAPTLLHVFVSIEMTGQSVAFEQKFQYRRPMYIALDYIWGIDKHKQKIKALSREAEENINSAQPPLFLQFINLLINDAIFLLDEALSYMTKLRELQQQRDNGDWTSLPSHTRQQNEANFQHMGLLARFHNVMSNETIHTLQWLTSEITSIFCHPVIVDRITAMLNYFLLHLVGPQKKNLKVKDMQEYEFKPQELVRDISRIYLHLGLKGKTAKAFCLAVIRDGRSYSPDLFPQTHAVLIKIGQGLLATQIEEIAAKVEHLAVEQNKEEEALDDAPDEFLDPIMNTIMRDPVRLPTSGMYCDRATISRHLLSDQSDPFNRAHLTMDMVETAEELKLKIEQWLREKGLL